MVSPELGRIAPEHVIGVHVTQLFSFPTGDPAEFEGLTETDLAALDRLKWFYDNKFAFNTLHSQQPQSLAFALADSPVGLLAWNAQLFGESLDRDFILANVAIYWLTGTSASAMRFYHEDAHAGEHPTGPTTTPTGLAMFAAAGRPGVDHPGGEQRRMLGVGRQEHGLVDPEVGDAGEPGRVLDERGAALDDAAHHGVPADSVAADLLDRVGVPTDPPGRLDLGPLAEHRPGPDVLAGLGPAAGRQIPHPVRPPIVQHRLRPARAQNSSTCPLRTINSSSSPRSTAAVTTNPGNPSIVTVSSVGPGRAGVVGLASTWGPSSPGCNSPNVPTNATRCSLPYWRPRRPGGHAGGHAGQSTPSTPPLKPPAALAPQERLGSVHE